MRKLFAPTALAAATLMLAACGSSDDASTEANADTVEMPADEALEAISDEPVADPEATATDAPETDAEAAATAEQAADAAAGVAAEAAAAAEDTGE
ncbi:hypothetical protein OIK40_12585 [Erythrobacter sp. sf7]|uniref:Uncharacterized protein n=1 Tax=Erythrobacter fulvus TaxID=2987523 RepID=A0ABT5JS36_9SPHN|nr:hypothetical protein [Erythrobacter fulvus]MDC8755478.1 hypothetical protein [Erythrobacter fulvus]